MAEDLKLDYPIAELITTHPEDTDTDYGLPLYGTLPKPLSQIRLLKILWADDDPTSNLPLECHVSPVHFEDRHNPTPPFVAISYTWGPEKPTKNVLVNGKLCTVRYNCFYALWQAFHFVGSSTWVWIDGLCINQSNTEERGNQVQLMGSIYRQAEQVLACIGSHADNSEVVFLEKQSDHQDNVWLSSLAKLCTRPYWTRLWIVQECALASNLILLCSRDSLPASDFYPLIKDRLGGTILVPTILELSRTESKESDLLSLMKRFATQQCSEVKDRAFALYGLRKKDPLGHDIYARYEVSTLSIALDVAYVSDLSDVRALLDAFRILKIDLKDDTVQKLLTDRKHHTYIHPTEGIGLDYDSPQYLWYEEYEDPVFHASFHSYAVLEQNDAGFLDVSSTYRFRTEVTINQSKKFNRIWEQNGKEIYCGSILLGRTTEQAEAGDLLIWAKIEGEYGQRADEIFGMVVRHRQGRVYRVMGVAMLFLDRVKQLERLTHGLTEAARSVPVRCRFHAYFETTEDLALMLLLLHGNGPASGVEDLLLDAKGLQTCREACNKPLTRMAYSSHVRLE